MPSYWTTIDSTNALETAINAAQAHNANEVDRIPDQLGEACSLIDFEGELWLAFSNSSDRARSQQTMDYLRATCPGLAWEYGSRVNPYDSKIKVLCEPQSWDELRTGYARVAKRRAKTAERRAAKASSAKAESEDRARHFAKMEVNEENIAFEAERCPTKAAINVVLRETMDVLDPVLADLPAWRSTTHLHRSTGVFNKSTPLFERIHGLNRFLADNLRWYRRGTPCADVWEILRERVHRLAISGEDSLTEAAFVAVAWRLLAVHLVPIVEAATTSSAGAAADAADV